MADKLQCLVVGAGAVGLAVARAFAMSGREVLIVEKEDRIGQGTSSRNSEVIHAGIYYPQNSLKAKYCVEGRNMLYKFCETHGVPFKRCGKLIVATEDVQKPRLQELLTKGHRNGVEDLRRVGRAEARALEPNVECVEALFSPSTGILDSHAYMLALQGEAEDHGAAIALGTEVEDLKLSNPGNKILASAGGMQLECEVVVNCAGLRAPALARAVAGVDPGIIKKIPQGYFAKGNYFRLQGPTPRPFGRLVYPVPEAAGLGVHATIDLQGATRFGPDVEWVAGDEDYVVDPDRCRGFYDEIRKYWPGIEDGSLIPDYCGIRPKIQAPGEAAKDFLILHGQHQTGAAGICHLLGIESPGLTASLALGQAVTTITS
mmetsp:Transcript_33711/g.58249  ORF Transcript_33711/g.58249 Transcript_33711/m.58249 type:complete len:374 (+) Transcript_33711:259-1380(+)